MFERISERLLEPPEDVIFADCDRCWGEIYMGENYYASRNNRSQYSKSEVIR